MKTVIIDESTYSIGEYSHLKTCTNFRDVPIYTGSSGGASPGDSGGGLVFKNHNRYYLRGIVSTRNGNLGNSVATFTDLAYYVPWILEYIS